MGQSNTHKFYFSGAPSTSLLFEVIVFDKYFDFGVNWLNLHLVFWY